jgi:hypothetical protein
MGIPANHPLQLLFAELVQRHVGSAASVNDLGIARYIAGILVDFTHADRLYRIRSASGRRLEDVGEMLLESNPLLEGRSFLYEREVRKHIGDYTLFLSGLFPEYVARLPKKSAGLDAFIDYMRAGKESYRVVASFDQFEFRDAAPLFKRLAEQFELCVFGLNGVKRELEHNQRAWYRGVRQALGN